MLVKVGIKVEEFDARKIKIQTVAVQRRFIENQLARIVMRPDGSTEYFYAGHIYPENIKYFESKGWVITKLDSEMLTLKLKGAPVYLFIVSDDIVLTEEEMEEAETYVPEEVDSEEMEKMKRETTEFVENLFSPDVDSLE